MAGQDGGEPERGRVEEAEIWKEKPVCCCWSQLPNVRFILPLLMANIPVLLDPGMPGDQICK